MMMYRMYRRASGVYDAIRDVNSKYNSLGLTTARNYQENLKILSTDPIKKVIRNFTDSTVDEQASAINDSKNTVTKTWGEDFRKEFNKTDLVSLVKDKVYEKVYNDMIKIQKTSLQDATRGNITTRR